jgi:hypothetical protein
MNSPAPTRSYGRIIRLDLPSDLRLELVRRALEEHRSPDSQAEHMLEELLKRSAQRRQKAVVA